MRLITFLGTGSYAETTYTFNGAQCETCYIAAALASFLQADEITVLATEQAETAHAQGLREELERMHLPAPVIRRIPSGGETGELWEQFDIICAAVTEGGPEQVSFDITHGFRAQPFFAAAVINYLRATHDDVPDMQAFYGEWRKGETTSPVWDISVFIDLLNWSNALQGFVRTGHGGALAQLAAAENARIQKRATGQQRPKKLKSLADALQDFSANMATVRCPQIITGDKNERGSARKVLQLIDAGEAEVEAYFKPLAPLLGALRKKLAVLPADSLFGEQGHQAMGALAQLYLDYERYPEAAIVVREGWISLYADSGISEAQQLGKKQRSQTEERWREVENSGERRRADDLGNVRNDIQHGGFNAHPNPAEALVRDTRRFAAEFMAAQIAAAPAANDVE